MNYGGQVVGPADDADDSPARPRPIGPKENTNTRRGALRAASQSSLAAAAISLLVACSGSGSTSEAQGAASGSGGDPFGSGGPGATNGAGGGFVTSAAATGSGAGTGGNKGCGTVLTGTLRDFQEAHPDFEYKLGDDKGIVENDLGADQKPVYASQDVTPTTTGKANFDQWYRDVPGTNIAGPLEIALIPTGGDVYTFEDQEFFPIDDQGFGNEGHPHNYHFTYELHTRFVYNGGETFRFTGDDDLWTFVNDKLAIDLGGVHGAESQEIDLDQLAGSLGISPGTEYPLDFFFAERHTVDSHFRVDTTLVFVDCGIVPQ